MSQLPSPVLTLTRYRLPHHLNSFSRCEWTTTITQGQRVVSVANVTADRIYRAFGYCEITR